eukprot:COSAG02_NODE_6029_length_3860_cov_17.065142_3_plen_65_part_00
MQPGLYSVLTEHTASTRPPAPVGDHALPEAGCVASICVASTLEISVIYQYNSWTPKVCTDQWFY